MSGSTSRLYPNNLLQCISEDRVCKAFGIKIAPTAEVVQIAKAAGYDSLFIDLEHSTLSLRDAGQMCIAGLTIGVTPFVRVPHQCGNGFVQRVLDAGAMGVIFPHIHGVEDAQRAISICKYPPQGTRSVTMGLPQFGLATLPVPVMVSEANERGSTVFLMIETRDALENVEKIAALPGCDVLLVGSQDLSLEIGTMPDLDHPKFLAALERVGKACRDNGKIFAIAGVYGRPDLLKRIVNEFGARWVLAGQDASFLTAGAVQTSKVLQEIQETN